MGEDSGVEAYVEGDGAYGEKGRLREVVEAGVWENDVPCEAGERDVMISGGCTAMRRKGDI